ncbi:centrosomal protein of 55 kDa-like isoform X1 [Archocentrus centrarchus]|uniref:centrosomal protein of 55 kDa-like isoform X1 n=1 Tax=Archocentrus centrarchus TaxID=63155 RepID=UPI0011EA2409|nr:centrosomal protein of 55 kDa-like isoform X1 [Archocentrus centrarchus]XP_030603529.1 centrosomal protein of 55 kDa-like isoform X1 [Archocentrus centrarchus]XP_030603530.1 centrosomal protein of 55 kDa-like isoform X1 [Archocentrus centrarchus]XP_030603531.1 centrosomal protein of 55 kDa-like isoform X1 [Archocentrus centrarchus]
MAASKYKRSLEKKIKSELAVVVSSLRKENTCLKRSLAELTHQQSQHNRLIERFLSLETIRLECSLELKTKDEKTVCPGDHLCKKEKSPMYGVSSISRYSREIEEIEDKLEVISARCQYLKNKVTGKQDSTADEQASMSNEAVAELQNHLRDALEKNKQWLEYDQQREAYVRAILARMLWLEKQLNEANQARSQQHNEDHSDEKEKISQMQGHYERLLQKAKDELEVLRERVEVTQQNLMITQNWCKEREREVEELEQQLKAERMSRRSTQEDQSCPEDEEQEQTDENIDLQGMLDEEGRRSANAELQVNLFQRFMLNRHYADQEKIADLERQIKISSQDLEDERQNCSYLKEQMVKVLKILQKSKGRVAKQSKREEPDHSSGETSPPLSPHLSRPSLTSSPQVNVMNESILECPSCQAEYPVSHHRELMNHLEICLN